jgi:hypothetical protein
LLHHPEPVQSRHPSVGYDQLKIRRVFFHSGNGGASVGCDLNMVARRLQRLGKHVEDEHIVVGTQDA